MVMRTLFPRQWGQMHERTHSTRSAHTQARQNPTMERGPGYEVPPLIEEILVVDRCRDTVSLFSLRVWSVVGQPYYSGRYTSKSIHSREVNLMKFFK